MSKNDSPNYPDPADLVAAQAAANRINQFTPQGNLVFGTVDAQGRFVPGKAGGAAYQIQQTPFQRSMQTLQENVAQTLATQLGTQASGIPTADFSGLPQIQWQIDWNKIAALPSPEDFSADADAVTQATVQRALETLGPQQDLETRRLQQQLADRGLPIGSEAYTNELNRLQTAHAQALNDLALAAVQAGREEQQRLFGNAITTRSAQLSDQLQQMDLANQARQTGFGERQAVRNQSLQELAALLGGQYNPTPGAQFIQPAQIDVTGPYNAAYAARADAAAQQQRTTQGLLGGLFNLGSAAIPFLF